MIKWNCTRCYYSQRRGQKTCDGTNCTIPNLQRGYRYSFSVQAITDFGPGEISIISVLISRYFGKVRNLQASVDDDYNMTITWDPPLNLDAKDIKVTCQSLKTRRCCCFFCCFVLFLILLSRIFKIYCLSFGVWCFIINWKLTQWQRWEQRLRQKICNELASNRFKLCSSRKYPYPLDGEAFVLDPSPPPPHAPEISILRDACQTP